VGLALGSDILEPKVDQVIHPGFALAPLG